MEWAVDGPRYADAPRCDSGYGSGELEGQAGEMKEKDGRGGSFWVFCGELLALKTVVFKIGNHMCWRAHGTSLWCPTTSPKW